MSSLLWETLQRDSVFDLPVYRHTVFLADLSTFE